MDAVLISILKYVFEFLLFQRITAFSTFRDFQSLYVNIHQYKNLQNVLNFFVQDAATNIVYYSYFRMFFSPHF